MAKSIKLLDCSLRDGGYINDWNFGHDNLVSVFERVVDAGIDILEIGFLDERREFDINRSIMPDTDSVERIYGGLDRKNTMIMGMIDYGTCSLSHIKPRKESFIDGIRVIFKKHLRIEALEFCKSLKELGYVVFAQLVSVTSYSDDEMVDLTRLANIAKPDAVSMVDTYGLMHQNNLLHYFEILNDNLDKDIGIGYHAHNNFQMGYANCIEFLGKSMEYDRDIVVDGTLYGMGKGAGNAPIELVSMHLNSRYGKNYNINQMLEAIDSNIMSFTNKTAWGYNMLHYIAAINACHPNYVTYLVNQRTLSIQSVNEILAKLKGDKKLLYDGKLIEELYYKYLDVEIDDEEDIKRLGADISKREILLLGPGNNIKLQKDRIDSFIRDNNPVVIAVNFVPEDIRCDYLFLSNAKRYVQLAATLKNCEIPIISTSNLTRTNGEFDYKLRYSSLLCGEKEFRNNSFLMLLKVMRRISVSNVKLAGFDGYIDEFHMNYVDKKLEYHYSNLKSMEINEAVSEALGEMKNNIEMEFITDTMYKI